jgi:hypothetical protein
VLIEARAFRRLFFFHHTLVVRVDFREIDFCDIVQEVLTLALAQLIPKVENMPLRYEQNKESASHQGPLFPFTQAHCDGLAWLRAKSSRTGE